jgi:hypothetical protein
MPATRHDLLIEQGATYSEVLSIYDSLGSLVNLSDYTAVMQIREKLEDDIVLASSSLGVPTISLTLSPAGTITIGITATITSSFNFDIAVWDIKLTNTLTSVVSRPYEGEVKLSKSVARLVETTPPDPPTSTYLHNDLSSIQGGSLTERYHLTGAQHTTIAAVDVGEIRLVPKAAAVGTAEGTVFYCSTDKYVYVGVE